jgi:hypothetical protein
MYTVLRSYTLRLAYRLIISIYNLFIYLRHKDVTNKARKLRYSENGHTFIYSYIS